METIGGKTLNTTWQIVTGTKVGNFLENAKK